MKKNILLSLITFFSYPYYLVSQSNLLELGYTYTIMNNGSKYSFNKVLFDDGVQSLFIDKDKIEEKVIDKVKIVVKDPKKNRGFYHNRNQDIGLYVASTFGKSIYVKEDSLTKIIEWDLTDTTTKEILTYKCKLAKGKFRGRDYYAFYTDGLPYFTGPWKFVNLPGVVLQVYTTDNLFDYSVSSIKLNSSTFTISNPYSDVSITWKNFREYKILFLKKLMENQEKMMSEEKEKDVDYKVKDSSMELLQ